MLCSAHFRLEAGFQILLCASVLPYLDESIRDTRTLVIQLRDRIADLIRDEIFNRATSYQRKRG